jgi:FMN phosphatase YigB (HAD superfamily)
MRRITCGRFDFNKNNELIRYGPANGYAGIEKILSKTSKIYLVDFDQCLAKSNKYDKHFVKLLETKMETNALLRNYNNFCLTAEPDFEADDRIKEKIQNFKEQNQENKVVIWTARARETQPYVEQFLTHNSLSKDVDGLVFTAGNKISFVEALIKSEVTPENIFVIDDTPKNIEAAKLILPEENVEFWNNQGTTENKIYKP